MDADGPDLWVAPAAWHARLAPVAARLGRLLLAEGAGLAEIVPGSVLHFRRAASLDARAIAEEFANQAAPWGILTLHDGAPNPDWVLARIREAPEPLNNALIASTDEGRVTVIEGRRRAEYRLDAIDLGRLVTKEQWSVCALHGHGENGHFRVGEQVFCSAEASGEGAERYGGLICRPPDACRRSPGAPAVWLGAIRADLLVTVTCSGWTVGGDLCPDNLSPVRVIEGSEVKAWLTGWGPVRISRDNFRALGSLLATGVSPGICAALMNDMHRRRWGYAPFILWGDPRPLSAPHGLRPATRVKLLAGQQRPVFVTPDAEAPLVGERFLVTFDRTGRGPESDVTERLNAIGRGLTRALAADGWIGVYLAGIRLNDRATGPYATKLELLRRLLAEQYLPVQARLEKARREGVISPETLGLAERLVDAVGKLDSTLAQTIASELHDIDLWEIFAPFGPIERAAAPSGTERCPQNPDHLLLVFSTREPVAARYVECATCGPVSMHQTDAVAFEAEVPATLRPGERVSITVVPEYAPPAAVRFITLSEKIGNRQIFCSVGPCSGREVFEIALPENLVAEAHHLAVATVADGRISWKGFRPISA